MHQVVEPFRQSQFHDSASWPAVDRRKQGNDAPDDSPCGPQCKLAQDIEQGIEQCIDRRLAINAEAHRVYFDRRFDAIITIIKDGFPGGDPRGHREVHEGYISEAKTRKELRDAVIKQLVTGTAWASILFLAGALWVAFKTEVKK